MSSSTTLHNIVSIKVTPVDHGTGLFATRIDFKGKNGEFHYLTALSDKPLDIAVEPMRHALKKEAA